MAPKFAQALASSKLPTPAVPTQWIESDCPAYPAGSTGGCAYDHIVFVSSSAGRGVVLHEYFHQVDRYVLRPAVRNRFARLMRIGAWSLGSDRRAHPDDHRNTGLRAPPSEVFADVAASCAMYPRYRRSWGWYMETEGYLIRLTRKNYNQVCGLLARGLKETQ